MIVSQSSALRSAVAFTKVSSDLHRVKDIIEKRQELILPAGLKGDAD
jgi:hypothetical protein